MLVSIQDTPLRVNLKNIVVTSHNQNYCISLISLETILKEINISRNNPLKTPSRVEVFGNFTTLITESPNLEWLEHINEHINFIYTTQENEIGIRTHLETKLSELALKAFLTDLTKKETIERQHNLNLITTYDALMSLDDDHKMISNIYLVFDLGITDIYYLVVSFNSPSRKELAESVYDLLHSVSEDLDDHTNNLIVIDEFENVEIYSTTVDFNSKLSMEIDELKNQ